MEKRISSLRFQWLFLRNNSSIDYTTVTFLTLTSVRVDGFLFFKSFRQNLNSCDRSNDLPTFRRLIRELCMNDFQTLFNVLLVGRESKN